MAEKTLREMGTMGNADDCLTAPIGVPESHLSAEMEARRAAFIRSLRDCATFLEAHPTIGCPVYNVFNVFVDTKAELAAYARAASWEKTYNDSWFALVREFGPDLRLSINAHRSVVCRKVVTGTRIVPEQPERVEEVFGWVCDEGVLA